MDYFLKNEHLQIRVAARGGELQSIRSAGGREFLWQGDPAYWKSRAPNLFPFIGRLIDETYSLRGQKYHLPIHGFLPKMPMQCVKSTDNLLIFRVTDSEETRSMYPFLFYLDIRYKLSNHTLSITYTVHNTGADTMFFGIGGHPGFQVPLDDKLTFDDYFLEFDTDVCPERILFSKQCFVQEQTQPFYLEDSRLPLSHNLFDEDAIVLYHAGKTVTLRSENAAAFVRVEFPDMPYIGFWHMPKTDAPYICIEPWSSLPARDGLPTILEEEPGLIHLPAGQCYENTWTITCFSSAPEKP